MDTEEAAEVPAACPGASSADGCRAGPLSRAWRTRELGPEGAGSSALDPNLVSQARPATSRPLRPGPREGPAAVGCSCPVKV